MERKANPWKIFVDERPEVAKAYQELMGQVNKDHVLDDKTLALIQVAIYSTIRDAGTLRHFAEEALKAGATKEEVTAAALMAFATGVVSAELSIPIILDIVEKSQRQ